MKKFFSAFLIFVASQLTGSIASADEPLDELIVHRLSHNNVAITATFSGSEIFVYGAVDRNRRLLHDEDAPDVIIAIQGPSEAITVRKKARQLGVWANDEAIRIASAPSFYAVATSDSLDDILREQDDNTYRISPNKAVRIVGSLVSTTHPEDFRRAAIRIREDEGLYRVEEGAVSQEDDLLFHTRMQLPANIVEGNYIARVFLLRNGRVIDEHSSRIYVRKSGLERIIYSMAHNQPFIYAILSIAFALFAGWAASEVFRRINA